MVSGKATWPTPHRVKVLVNMALPTTVTELRSFLGAISLYEISDLLLFVSYFATLT